MEESTRVVYDTLVEKYGKATLNKVDTAYELQIGVTKLDQLRVAGDIKYKLVGQQIRFNLLDLAMFINGETDGKEVSRTDEIKMMRKERDDNYAKATESIRIRQQEITDERADEARMAVVMNDPTKFEITSDMVTDNFAYAFIYAVFGARENNSDVKPITVDTRNHISEMMMEHLTGVRRQVFFMKLNDDSITFKMIADMTNQKYKTTTSRYKTALKTMKRPKHLTKSVFIHPVGEH